MPAKLKELNIIIAGVGGQGVVLMSEILGNAAVRDGLKVRGSEVLGMAQRGGSVFSNIRFGRGRPGYERASPFEGGKIHRFWLRDHNVIDERLLLKLRSRLAER